MEKELIGYLSGVFAVFFYAGIVRSILRGISKPSRTTWIIWGINDLLIFCASYFVGARNTLWVPLVYTIGSLVCLVLSIHNDPKPISLLDRCCLALSLLAWALWAATSSAFLALVLGVAVNTLGGVPTWHRVWDDQRSEHWAPWAFVLAAAAAQLIAVERFTFALVLFPFDSLLVSGMVILLTLYPRREED
jgi:hypothetical protein